MAMNKFRNPGARRPRIANANNQTKLPMRSKGASTKVIRTMIATMAKWLRHNTSTNCNGVVLQTLLPKRRPKTGQKFAINNNSKAVTAIASMA
ncbi:peptidase m16 inactive domain protein [Lasius niger]|uniref:Peptidase m16 inactive domain protein n=1 Tax=Lasius niger TaxID=67767 RepID=A0A0J7MRZ9_LASNI|nr:peptidase m16 inactive domain protein [Lasius niger]